MRQSTRGQRRGGLLKLVGISMWGALGALSARGDGSALLYPLALATFAIFVHGAYREFRNGKRALYPNSWSYAPKPRGRRQESLEGRVTATSTLVAPLTGRPCVAYEIGVRHDSQSEDEDWSWSLLEQRSVDLSVGGRGLDSMPHLRLRRRVLAEELGESACKELRKRGLDPKRPGYTVFETIVCSEEFAAAQRYGDGGWVLSAG
jgi:hypothetical protein